MSTHHAGDAALGIGNSNGAQDGSQDGEGSQRETGGSGGSALTGDQLVRRGGQPAPPAPEGQEQEQEQEPEQELADSGARGARDTRSRQAKKPGSGLGTPETGANQEPGDMEHKR